MSINILIADDDNVFRELVEDILRKNGYHIFSACDGKEALEKFYKYHSQLDLVILDVMMPAPDGWETLAEIRNISCKNTKPHKKSQKEKNICQHNW